MVKKINQASHSYKPSEIKQKSSSSIDRVAQKAISTKMTGVDLTGRVTISSGSNVLMTFFRFLVANFKNILSILSTKNPQDLISFSGSPKEFLNQIHKYRNQDVLNYLGQKSKGMNSNFVKEVLIGLNQSNIEKFTDIFNSLLSKASNEQNEELFISLWSTVWELKDNSLIATAGAVMLKYADEHQEKTAITNDSVLASILEKASSKNQYETIINQIEKKLS